MSQDPETLSPTERQQAAYVLANDTVASMGQAIELVFDIDQGMEAGKGVSLDLLVQLPHALQDGFFHPLIIRVHHRVMAAVQDTLNIEPEITVVFTSIHETDPDPIGKLRSVVERCPDNAAALKMLDAAAKAFAK